ncbi:MAG: PH domain-containing protein, partial [Wenzhouxiangella sp.]|nr:PH domain-containing protein [Wenzhouxiangella sp.]
MSEEAATLPNDSEENLEWHRLAPVALLFLLLSAIQKFVRENLFMFAGAGFGVAVFDFLDAWKLGMLALALLLMGLVGTMIFHRRFRFRIEEDAVRVRRGLLEKKELRVRFARVQSVQIGQPFYFKPFELVRFTL